MVMQIALVTDIESRRTFKPDGTLDKIETIYTMNCGQRFSIMLNAEENFTTFIVKQENLLARMQDYINAK